MNSYIDLNEVAKKIDLPEGLSLVILDRLAKESIFGPVECARNIFLIDVTAKIVWQVHTDFDAKSGPFTNVFLDGNAVKAYRWDGGMYEIDLKNGKGVPVLLMK
ncbi:hypothetical protein FHW67_004210 [Herbaspirillum sp. Sphag1AN]|uniref:hypothetical protein n=1 Tax=unclassified Herbaspirillum TaxID=2624150 RepID=UPI001608C905|nr:MULTISPECIES: hypothetical protein [unclassified Herbaspirillum]MBB3214886.1 hypothetical protein [Herbaspirillum sp. Sphag1AN]MBB3248080.1 hypothetical protein [Herbaspirillum sp. Sphag64]